ncbi:sphingosine kinase 2 [Ornithorhynchus anatinus]|uniref:sphingosine kinase n=1 Tax=Ornithorhynchus anatinus TaxID=9258 RepID=A0A6I8NGC2_ORNAN|nr:sphingosine kinase 2 [Ornithorhynchus anatinus]XP_039769282.1 sphingosine kinase 2 [Ornithorhynchus anatinus]
MSPDGARAGEETLLHGEFGAHPARGTRYALTLTLSALHIQRLVPRPDAEQRTVVPMGEVSGCHTLRSLAPGEPAAFFAVYAYPRRRRGGRRRAARTFRVDGDGTYEENQAVAERWATVIKCLVRGVALGGNTVITPELLPRPRRLLLLVNPFGGRGQAWQWCQNHVLPMISEADLSFNLIQTERQNHARELVRGLNLAEWDGIVTLSGDGLLYEVVNGLMERPDWAKAIKTPVGILPCGSGNALAGAVNQHGGFEPALGLDLLLNCSLLLCRGARAPLDLLSVTLASGTRIFSFLSVAWGFVSDVDVESERFRPLGPARFTLGTALRLASLHTYRGRLSYLPAAQPLPGAPHRPLARSATAMPPPVPPHGSPLHRAVSDMALAEERGLHAPAARSPAPSPSPPPSPFSPSRDLDLTADPPQPRADPAPPSSPAPEGPADDLLPPLGEPLPPEWVTLEGDFVLLLAISPSHLGADLVAAPFAHFGDGVVHLCWVRAGVSRAALLRLFLAMERGTHFGLGCPQLAYAAARAFRLEPLTRRGILTVDGERVEYGPLQAQVHGGLGCLLTGNPPCGS